MPSVKEIYIGEHKIVAKAFNEDKTGIPVIFIHGITATIDVWEPIQIPIFSENFRWYSLSLPGHFPALLPNGFKNESLTPDMMSQVLTGAIQEIVDEAPVILVGHSTGGFAALCIAAKNPGFATGIISISGFAHGRWTGALGIFQKLARLGIIGRLLFKINFSILSSNRWICRSVWDGSSELGGVHGVRRLRGKVSHRGLLPHTRRKKGHPFGRSLAG